MSDKERLTRLQQISALQRDLALTDLSSAALARDHSLTQIAALDRESPATDLPALVEEQVRFAYRCWADERRAELNLTLARQTAEWMAQRDAAALSFGRAEVLDRLAKRKKPGQR